MSFTGVDPNNSNATNLNQVNNLMREVRNSKRTQIFKDDTGGNRVLLGKGKNGFYGLRVSPEGKDVTTTPDNELIFSSDYNTFKIVETGTIVIPSVTLNSSTTTGSSTYTLNHDYGESLACMAYLTDFYGGVSPLPGFRVFQGWESIYFDTSNTARILPLNEYVTFATYSDRVEFTNWFNNIAQPLGDSYTATEVTIKYYLLLETAA